MLNKTAIDIELVSHKLLKLASKFLSDEEQEFCQTDLEKLTLLWCAKETLYKIYPGRGLHFRENLFVRAFPYQKEGLMSAEIDLGSQKWVYQMHYMIRDGYALTFIEE
jgi:4'-phosphopantetheinyl transferase EntD